MKTRLALLGIVVAGGASGLWAIGHESDSFPHLEHEGLFPLCVGCHEGVETGQDDRLYPDPAECADCHDGTREERVEWTSPDPRASTLDFSHPDHVQAIQAEDDEAASCQSCHAEPGAASRMAVQAAAPEACQSCHAHEAVEHLAVGGECQQCHVPLGQATGLPASRIADFPKPPGHDLDDFVQNHDPGDAAGSCATCHARESCTRCHLNGESVSPIQGLAPDPRVASLVAGTDPVYPEPASHQDDGWRWEHGAQTSQGTSACANCHIQENCLSCHTDAAPAGLSDLADPAPQDHRGVRTVEASLVHSPAFSLQHAASAALEGQSCASCHATTFCEACHDGSASPAFHLPNFLARHGPEAYGNAVDCSSCHSTEVFCRACHTEAGLGSQGSLGVAFHSARPFWLLGHGTAARQGLEGCVTCHTQTDCSQCHSAASGWRVNPHGPGFDPVPAREANPFSCLRCHRGEIPP